MYVYVVVVCMCALDDKVFVGVETQAAPEAMRCARASIACGTLSDLSAPSD